MSIAVYHFAFPSEATARLMVHLMVRQLRDDVAICRDGCSVVVLDASGRDRRAELLSVTNRYG